MFDKLFRHAGAVALSGISQMVNSLTNFGIVCYLVQTLEKEDFGRYSLGFAIYLVIAAILTAMFAVQYVVNIPDCAEFEKRNYAMSHVTAVAVVGSAIMLIATMLRSIVSANFGVADNSIGLFFPVTFAAASFAIRDILVRIAFVEQREWLVLGSAIFVAGTAAFVFIATDAMSITPSAPMALVIVAISQLAGAGFPIFFLRLPWHQFNLSGLHQAFADSWQGGRWHALTSIVYSVRSQVHNFVVLPILGFSALAEINAARVLLTPAVMAIPPLFQVLLPRLAERRNQGPLYVFRATWMTGSILVGFAVIYSATILFLLDDILPIVLGQSYSNLNHVVFAWCIVTIFLAARNSLTMGIEISKGFRNLLVVNAIAALVAVIMANVLTKYCGGVGAIWALAIAEAFLCFMLYWVLHMINTKGKDVNS